VIECLPWNEPLRRHDWPDALVYLDPPYHVYERRYGPRIFGHNDHARLADTLRPQGRWVLSYKDCPENRSLSETGADIKTLDVAYSIGGAGARRTVFLISGWTSVSNAAIVNHFRLILFWTP